MCGKKYSDSFILKIELQENDEISRAQYMYCNPFKISSLK